VKLRLGRDVGDNRILRQGRIRRLAEAVKSGLSKGRRDERGAVAIMFALAVVVLAPLILGLFDVYTASEQRARLQDALDAAALYAARSDYQTDAEIDAVGDKALTVNLRLLRGATLLASDFHLTDGNTKVTASATIQPMALAPAFWAHPAITVSTDVVRNSKNLEVSLVLDITGSMGTGTSTGTRISDLRSAASSLVDLVVKDTQTPYYSKVAVVPWSMGVNVGTYADSVRGAVVGTKPITGLTSWYTGTQKTVSGATKAKPIVITANGHGFANGDTVMITGVSGMTQINGVAYKVAGVTTNTFQLQTPAGVNIDGTSGYSTYSSGGKVSKCVRTDCSMQVTAAGHGYVNGEGVYLLGVGPAALGTAVNDKMFTATGVTTNTYNIFVPSGPTTAYTTGGTSYCTIYGCEYRSFTNGDASAVKLFQQSSCVSERTGTHAYDDAAPSTTFVGFNYPATSATLAGTTAAVANPCLTNQIIPLSTDKTAVKAAINTLAAAGSTGGQVGVAWGWYMISPNFGYLWPSASRPAAYTAPDTLKVVVLMTDGALNTDYCSGVISQDSLSGSGSIKDHINCDSPNGNTFNQSKTLCANMKAAGVIVYTVGFQITGDVPANDLMDSCATDAKHEYLPTSGLALSDAFKAIGADINNLRLSH
jgi:Flp pilus assembly protein TadG